ncbi:hypothetical protein [Pseudotabrizicola sp. 4114]|uniref:calcium-binding protein n=1 Tax=Pseudotabrizicola sp. 4114 TaxID=2817731 RepID=UPI00285590EC|nr:Ca2+-binding RTX toxin-like protein [Pseudorhodobacter sp. 4114]
MPTNLSASVTGNTLFVSGAAATNGYSRVEILRFGSSVEVTDNGAVGVLVPISGAPLATHNVDASGVTGAGIYLYSTSVNTLARNVTGSAQADYIYVDGSHLTNDQLYGGAGNDIIYGGNGDDRLYGGTGADSLYGGNGDDFLYGGGGWSADTFDGGAGTDTLVLAGARSEYQIDIVNGLYQISHIGGTQINGVDSFANIELLRFTDQTIAINPAPTNLSASVTGNTLFVSGAAADATGRVEILRFGSSVEVMDNGAVKVLVPVSGAPLATHNVDASGVTGAGIYLYSTSVNTLARNVTGSAQADYIYVDGSHLTNDQLYGGAGDDFIFGGNGNDRLYGGTGADSLYGGNGDDFLYGGGGWSSDTFDGGAGIDTLVLAGARSEYQIDIVNGLYQISHIGGTQINGVDSFANIERLMFTDQTIDIDPAPTNLSASVTGNTLFVSGAAATNGYNRVEIVRFGSSVEVMDNGAVKVLVPVSGAPLATHNIDASGVTGAGIYLYSESVNSLAREIRGSAQADYIDASGSHLTDDRLYGGAGNDIIYGGNGDDRLYGGTGADSLYGGNGDDFLYGGGGWSADTFDGGAGTDTLVLAGARSEYQIDIVNGLYQISHIGGTQINGVDSFANIERLMFTDQTIDIDDGLFV